MNTPYLRMKAVVQAKELLGALATPDATPGVPDHVRTHAASLLTHYPTLQELQQVHDALPELFGPPPPFPRLRGHPQTDAVIAVSTSLPGPSNGQSGG
jgi:hypothetical protein